MNNVCILKNSHDVKNLIRSNVIGSTILDEIIRSIDVGTTTYQINDMANYLCNKYNVEPAFKNYNNFKYSICTSVNNVAAHGKPSNTMLNNGDIISIDFGVNYKNYKSDKTITVGIGNISDEAKSIISISEKALHVGIKSAIGFNRVSDIAIAIENFLEDTEYKAVKQLVGHGIGKDLHEFPQVPNFYKKNSNNSLLYPNMVIAIEPIIIKKSNTTFLRNNEMITTNGGLSSLFEHSILITENDPIILSRNIDN